MPGPTRRLLPSLCVPTQASMVTALVALTLLVATGCAPADPQAQVAAARADYEAQLSGWIVRQPEPMEPMPDPAAAAQGDGGEADPGAESAISPTDDEMMADPEPVAPDPTEITVLFDVLLLFSGSAPLAGLTLDITHADPAGVEKAVRPHYVEVSSLLRGSTSQVAIELDGWDLADGDQFSVEVRKSLSDAERATYREFQEAGSGSN